MEQYVIEKEIRAFFVAATSFPDGVLKAHQTLHAMLPSTHHRNFYGISFPDKNGNIIYRAAVEESYAGEAEKYGCETFIICKGNYMSQTIKGFMKDVSMVATTFQQLLAHPQLDHNGFCLEIYPNETDIICMVKLNPDDRSI